MCGAQNSRRRCPAVIATTVYAWVDHFDSWRAELARREDVADIRVALLVGSALVEEAAERSGGSDAIVLKEWSQQLQMAVADQGADRRRLEGFGAGSGTRRVARP